MRNITPKPMSIVGLAIGVISLVGGGWLIYSDFATFLKFVKLFVGFFLLLLGLGIVSASLRR
jgi:hypothetical protein